MINKISKIIHFLFNIEFNKNKIKKLIFILFNPRFIMGYFNLVFPLIELSSLLKSLPIIDNCIDVGSNKGQFSMIFRKYFNNTKIYSFEPQLNHIKTQKKFLKNTKFYNICLGNYNGTGILNVTDRDDSSSLLEPLINTHGIYKVNKKIKIKVKKLDDIIRLNKNKINLIKLDVQGFEYQVLLGAKNNLKNINYIIIELTAGKGYNKQVRKKKTILFLKTYNFKLKKIYNKTYNNNMWQADFLFIKNKSFNNLEK